MAVVQDDFRAKQIILIPLRLSESQHVTSMLTTHSLAALTLGCLHRLIPIVLQHRDDFASAQGHIAIGEVVSFGGAVDSRCQRSNALSGQRRVVGIAGEDEMVSHDVVP